MVRWIVVGLAAFLVQDQPVEGFVLLAQAEELHCAPNDDVCLAREFELRANADQSIRGPNGTQPECEDSEADCVQAVWDRLDERNLRRLIAIFEARGWPPFQDRAALGAWLSVQHADPTPGTYSAAFRVRALPHILAEVHAGRLKHDHYTLVADRNALARNERQPYGSLRACLDGTFDRTTIDSVELVDARRAEIGMDIMLSESLPLFDYLCERDRLSSAG